MVIGRTFAYLYMAPVSRVPCVVPVLSAFLFRVRRAGAGPGLECAQCSKRAAGEAVSTFEGFVCVHVVSAVGGTIIPSEDPAGISERILGRAGAVPHAVAAQRI